MDKEIVLWLMGGLFVIIGWLMSRKITQLEIADAAHTKEIATLREAKAELKLHISENYIKRSEIKEFMAEIRNELREISSKLDGKADK